ncbi:hypothetical protein PSHT_08398 [Puccinia striiformis]|uniref:Uncharacterized protein n=1 Tax=Puccinia striiformis TaxID=27350 RepID=A0A2S4VPF5_9BASI|nr:hypothetical protein PSHT_08398 [Puccinia striiformis]
MEPNQNCSKENSRTTIEPDEPIKHAKTIEDSSDSATSTTTIISSPEGSSSDQPKIHSSSSSSTPTQLPTTPPIPAASNLKKFKASSLSVNKKFLSQSAVSDGKLSKNLHSASRKNSFSFSYVLFPKKLTSFSTYTARLTSLSSSSSPGTPGTAPRLLTGKIGLNNSILNSTGSAGSGWAKTSLVTSSPLSLTTSKSPELSHPNPPNLKYSHSSESLKNSRGVEDGHPSSTTAINAFLNTHSAQPYPNTTNSVRQPQHHHQQFAHPSSSSSSPWVKLGNSTNGGINSLATDFPTAQEVAQHTKLKAQSIAAAVAARDKVVQDRAAASAAYNQQLLQTLDGFRGTHLDPNASHWDEMEDEDDMFGEVVEFGDGTQYKVTEVVPPATDPGTSSGNETLPQSGISQGLNLKDRLSEDPRRSHHQPTSEEIDSMPPFLRGRAELKSLYNERIGKFEPYSGKPNEKPRDHHPHVQLLQRQRDGPNDPSSSTPHSARSPHSTGPDGKPTDHNPTQHHRHQTHQPDHHNLIPPSRTSLSQPLSPPSASHTSAPSTASAPIKVADDTPEAADKQPTAPDDSNSALKYRKPDLDQDEAFKRRSEDVSSRPSVWKPKIASVSSSQGRAEDRQSQQTTPTDRASKPISIQKRPVPSAPAADQRWRPSQDNAPKPASRSDTRQLPPHIQPDLVKTSDPTSPAPRAASPQPETRPVPKSSADSRSSPPASLPTYASPNMSANTPRVLDADKEARVKAAVVVTTFKESPQAPSATPPSSSKPKDSLKTTPIRPGSDNQLKEIDTGASSPQGQTTSSSTAVYIAGRPRTLLPRTIETTTTLNASSGSKTPSGSALPASGSSTPAAPPKIPITPILTPALSNPAMKKPSSVRKAARFDIPTTVESKPTAVSTSTSFPSSAPKCVNRDPIVFFDATRQERPASPGPAWKAFTVNQYTDMGSSDVDLSPRSLSRDELLFRKKYVRGILVSQVQFPKNSVSDLDFTKAPSAPKDSSSEPLTRDDGSMRGTRGRGAAPVGSRGRGRGRADETTSWRRPVEEEKTPSVTATPVPDSITTPPVDSTLSITTAPIEPPKSSESPTTRRTKVKIPDGLKVAFHKPAHILSSTSSSDLVAASSGKPKPSSPTRSPTQDTTPMPLTPPVATPPRSSSIACMSGSKGSTSPWTKSPLAFSVLDSHTKNVWSQPDGQITGQPPPSGKTENSLEGITDDFPASLPRTLNDFNAVEEPSSSTRHPAAQFSSSSSSRKSTELPGPNKREQNGESPNTLHLGSNNNSDEPPKTNGLVQHPYMNPPGGPAHYNNESSSRISTSADPQPTEQSSHPQYPSISGIYPGQQPTAPWSPSPGPGQPNGYARSPQLYSPNTSFSSPVTSASYPSHPHSVGPSPISDGPGFNKSPGPIAPRGSRSSVPTSTSHPNRQQQPNELVNLPSNSNTSNNNNNLRRNQPNYSPHPPSSTSKAQNSNTGHSYQVSVGSLDLTSQHPPNNNLPPGGGNGVGPGGVYPDSAGFGPFHHSQTGLLHHQQSLPIPTSSTMAHLGGGTGPQSSHLVGPHNLHHSHLPHPHSHHAQQQQQSNLGAGAHPSPQGHYISHPPPFHPVLHQQQQQHRIPSFASTHPSISNYPTNHHPHQQHQHHIPPHNHHHQLINNHHQQQQQQQTLNGNINLSNNTHRPFIGHNHQQQQQQPPPPAPAPSSAASSSPTITTSSPTTTTTKTTHPSRNNNHSASSNNHSVLGNGIPIGNSVVHTPKGNLNHGPVGFGP